MPYAIISLGGKQHRVQEGQRLIVDRLPTEEGKTFNPQILLAGGDGDPVLSPTDVQVTARVVKHDLGPKIRIGKYRKRTGYRRHNGHRSRITQIEIESIGKKTARRSAKEATESPVRDSGPGEGARGNREVPPTTTTAEETE
jgi:large subunit ribosomal protein L21